MAIVKRWPWWGGRRIIWQYFQGVQHVYCAKFMHPIVVIIQSQIMYRDKIICKKLELCFVLKCKRDKMRKVLNVHYNYRRRLILCLLQQYKMKQTQNLIAAINHQCVTQNKFHDHSWLFHQSLKKLAVVERLFRQLGRCFSGLCREV